MTDHELCKALRTGVGLPLDHCEIAAERIEALVLENETLARAAFDSSSKVRSLKADYEALAGQAATYKAAYDEAQVRIAELEAERDHFRNGMAALKADNDRLTRELAAESEWCERWRKSALETDRLWVDVVSQRNRQRRRADKAEAVISGLEAWRRAQVDEEDLAKKQAMSNNDYVVQRVRQGRLNLLDDMLCKLAELRGGR